MFAVLRVLLLLALGVTGAVACRSDATSATSSQAQPERPAAAPPPQAAAPLPVEPVVKFTPPPAGYNGPLPPIPDVPYPLPRSPEVVRAVYTFAARHPEVLHYVPCFCGCQRSGHDANDDCFIKSRDAKGRPEWESHGMG